MQSLLPLYVTTAQRVVPTLSLWRRNHFALVQQTKMHNHTMLQAVPNRLTLGRSWVDDRESTTDCAQCSLYVFDKYVLLLPQAHPSLPAFITCPAGVITPNTRAPPSPPPPAAAAASRTLQRHVGPRLRAITTTTTASSSSSNRRWGDQQPAAVRTSSRTTGWLSRPPAAAAAAAAAAPHSPAWRATEHRCRCCCCCCCCCCVCVRQLLRRLPLVGWFVRRQGASGCA